MRQKKIEWETESPTSTTINAKYFNVDAVCLRRNTEMIQPQKMIPLICTQCGGSVDKDTNKCRMCGTEFVWR